MTVILTLRRDSHVRLQRKLRRADEAKWGRPRRDSWEEEFEIQDPEDVSQTIEVRLDDKYTGGYEFGEEEEAEEGEEDGQ